MVELSFSFLGPFEVRAGAKPASFATNAARALLAYVVIESQQAHGREQLAALFWPDHSQADAFTNLRQTLARVRKGLPADADALEITPQTIRFAGDAASVDIARFERLLAACAAHPHAELGACAECAARLHEATALYRGDLLDQLALDKSEPFGDWLLLKREALRQRQMAALQALAEYHEAAGDFEQARELAARQLALEPWREEAHAQMMRALAGLGQRSAALSHYETCRRVLERELGAEPNAEIRALYDALRTGGGPAPAPGAVPHLPAQATAFVGRERELAEFAALLAAPDTRLLTLVGAGGMGKTRLALELGQRCCGRFRDGAHFVSLAPLAAATSLPGAIAAAIGLSLHGGDPRHALLQSLRDKRALLILDNFEHLLDGAALVAELVAAAPHVSILVTSREPLNLRGEQRALVGSLDYAPGSSLAVAAATSAVRLFVQSARRARADFALSEANLSAVQRICQLVQGMPLALELAAAWAEALPVETIAHEIGRSADFLSTELRDVPERQRSMRAVFEWSWALLSDAERAVFRQLAVFRGGFTRHAAQAVVGAALPVLTGLLRKSLLHWDGEGSDRYAIHELLRQFADEQLDAAPSERAAVEARHSAFYLRYAAQRELRLTHHEPLEAGAELATESDNILQAWASPHARPDDLDQSACALWQFFHNAGLAAEGERAFGLAIERLRAHCDMRLRSKLTAFYASMLLLRGRYDLALEAAREAVARGGGGAGVEGEAVGLFVCGQASYWKGLRLEARERMERALEAVARQDAAAASSEALGYVAWSAHVWLRGINLSLGEYARARSHGLQALELCRALNRRLGEVHSLCNLADVAREMRDLAAARRDYEQALRLTPRVGYKWGEAVIQFELGEVVRLQGEYGLARELIGRGLAVAREIADELEEARALAYLGRLLSFMGHHEGAAAALDQFLHMTERLATPELRIEGLLALAVHAQHTGNYGLALAYAEEAARLAPSYSSRYTQAHAFVLLGQAQAQLQVGAAAASYREAIARYEALNNASLAAEPRAGLAALALAEGERHAALALVEQILPVLAAHRDVGLDEPFGSYLVCYRVLAASQDARASAVLHTAHGMLRTYADHISDLGLRRSFFERVPTHRELDFAANAAHEGARADERVSVGLGEHEASHRFAR